MDSLVFYTSKFTGKGGKCHFKFTGKGGKCHFKFAGKGNLLYICAV